MEKIKFTFEDAGESVEFFVLEQTKLNGSVYILVRLTGRRRGMSDFKRDGVERRRREYLRGRRG